MSLSASIFIQSFLSEFRLRLQELRPLLAHCKERHAAEYRTVRVKIVAHAVMDYHKMNFPDTRKALAGIAGYLITTPYAEWCRHITDLINADTVDTPADRESLHNRVLYLLCNDIHVSQCFLNCSVAFCVRRGLMKLPSESVAPASSCVDRV